MIGTCNFFLKIAIEALFEVHLLARSRVERRTSSANRVLHCASERRI